MRLARTSWEFIVRSADKVRRRISLSLRQLHGQGPAGAQGEEFYPGADYEPELDGRGGVTGLPPEVDQADDAEAEDEAEPEAEAEAETAPATPRRRVHAAASADVDEDVDAEE